MSDPKIPFIRQYSEWAILAAARRVAASWRKRRYRNHTMVVPENKQYLAANSAKRNPNAPRGARFPLHSSKRDRTTTPDNDGSDDERVPVLPPGPSTAINPVGFPNAGANWDSRFSSDYPIQPLPGPSQLPFNNSFSQVSSTPWTSPWAPTYPQSYPSSNTSNIFSPGQLWFVPILTWLMPFLFSTPATLPPRRSGSCPDPPSVAPNTIP
jgi:hypothetical protein